MTFEEFQATRRDVDSLKDIGIVNVGETIPRPGIVYFDFYYIEKSNANWPADVLRRGAYYLHLGNQEWFSDDLHEMELRLYGYASAQEGWRY